MHTILVPLDGSALAEQILPYVGPLAQILRARVRLLCVIGNAEQAALSAEESAMVYSVGEELATGKEYVGCASDIPSRYPADYLAAHAMRLRATGIEVDVEVCLGSPPECIVKHASREPETLIALATHGHGGLRHWALGSVADQVIQTSSTPIFIVRDGAPPPQSDRSFERILIPLDGSARSEAIVEYALALGQLMQSEYTLLRVVAPFIVGAPAPFTTPTDFDPDRTMRLQAEAQHELDSVAQRLQTTSTQVRTRVLISEQVAAAILEDAGLHGIDLIAMSTAGHSRLARLLMGSVADKVLRGTEIPLLLYRPESPHDRVGYQTASAAADTPRTIS